MQFFLIVYIFLFILYFIFVIIIGRKAKKRGKTMQIHLILYKKMERFFAQEPQRKNYAAVTAVALVAIATFAALFATAVIGTTMGISAVAMSAAALGIGILLLFKKNSQSPQIDAKATEETANKVKVEAFLTRMKSLINGSYNYPEWKEAWHQAMTAFSNDYTAPQVLDQQTTYLSCIVAYEAFGEQAFFYKTEEDKKIAREALDALIDLGVDMTAGETKSALMTLFQAVKEPTIALPFLQRMVGKMTEEKQKALQSADLLQPNMPVELVKFLVDETSLVLDEQYMNCVKNPREWGPLDKALLLCQRASRLPQKGYLLVSLLDYHQDLEVFNHLLTFAEANIRSNLLEDLKTLKVLSKNPESIKALSTAVTILEDSDVKATTRAQRTIDVNDRVSLYGH
jgi:hypothetical protein